MVLKIINVMGVIYMLMENARKFKKYLEQEGIDWELFEDDEGTYIETEHDLESGETVQTLIYFPLDVPLVRISGYFTELNFMNENSIYKAINELNSRAPIKYVLHKDGSLGTLTDIYFDNNFSNEVILGWLLIIGNEMNDNYSCPFSISSGNKAKA